MKYVQVNSSIRESCRICKKSLPENNYYDSVADLINHYVSHGAKVEHIGTETQLNDSGEPYDSTVAILSYND